MNRRQAVTSQLSVSVLLCCIPADSVTLLSYGSSNPNDVATTDMSDDSSKMITTTVPLTFFGNLYNNLWLGSNGYIALENTVAYANQIPSPQNLTLIAPLFDDLTPSGSGNLYYRQSSDAGDTNAASALIVGLFPEVSIYTAKYVLVVTWSEYVKHDQPQTLTFQALVVTDDVATYALFLYHQLTTGLTADVGIDGGDGINFYKLCIGNTPDIQRLPQLKQSGCSEEGVFGFRVDVVNPEQGVPAPWAHMVHPKGPVCGFQLYLYIIYSDEQSSVSYWFYTGTYACTDIAEDSNCAGCDELTNPKYGSVDTSSGTLEGNTATYSCLGGYDLVGDDTRKCLSNNTWSGSVPVCRIRASYYCEWADTNHTLVTVIFIINLAGAGGVMAWDTQKYEDKVNPDLNDTRCETLYTNDPTVLTFSVDPNAEIPDCGVRITGASVKTLEVTIRVYYNDERFDRDNDRIYKFSCTTDTLLPRIEKQTKHFSDIDITTLPVTSRTLQLLVTAPNSVEEITEAQIGQLIKLRIIYDNTANNAEPYGIYVTECMVADTISFDALTVSLVDGGCVAQQTPGAVWYMSRSFQQTSLSESGLFIADSGTFELARFINRKHLFFRCVIGFCFFSTTAPNLCTEPGRRKKRDTTFKDTIYTSLQLLSPEEPDLQRGPEKSCVDNLIVYSVLGSFCVLMLFVACFTCFLFWRVIHERTRARKRHYTVSF